MLHYLCIILTLNMLTKGMIDVKFPFFIVCSSGYHGMHVYSGRYYSTVVIFWVVFFRFCYVFFGYFYFLLHKACGIFSPFSTKTTELMQPCSYQGSLLPSLFLVGTSDAFVINFMNRVQIRRICMESLEHNWANVSETICFRMLVFWQVGLLDVVLS